MGLSTIFRKAKPAIQLEHRSAEEKALVRRLDMFLLTFGCISQVIKYLDQQNINNAYVSGMKEDLNLYGNELNYFTTYFNISYCLMLIPSQAIMTYVRPSYWLTGLEITWGVITGLMALTKNAKQVYVLRVFLGLCESSAWPGMMTLLMHWYTPMELAKRMGFYQSCQTLGYMMSGALQAAIIATLEGKGLSGWRWLFVINAIMTVVWGVLGFFMLPDVPNDPNPRAFWFKKVDAELAMERLARHVRAEPKKLSWAGTKRAFSGWTLYFIAALYIATVHAQGGYQYFNLFLKALTNPDGSKRWSTEEINVIPIAGGGIAVAFVWVWAILSDTLRTRWTLIITQALIGLIPAIIMTLWTRNPDNVPVSAAYASYFISYLSLGTAPLIFSWLSELIPQDPEARSLIIGASVAGYYAVSAWSGILIWPAKEAPYYRCGWQTALSLWLVVILMTCVLRFVDVRYLMPKRKLFAETLHGDAIQESEVASEHGDTDSSKAERKLATPRAANREVLTSMAFDSGPIHDDDKAQHEALVQEVNESQYKISAFSLIWKPAVLILIPIALVFVSGYFGFSWTRLSIYNDASWEWPETGDINEDAGWTCLANGTASLDLATVWDASQFLDISLGFGRFKFGVAKGLDVAWDLIIGRGGQILLAIFSYRILGAVLLQSMETRAVSFYTYTAIGLDRGPLFCAWASLRELWADRCQGKRVLVTVVFASLYLLAFPTFVSTMTGYKPIYTPWLSFDSDDAMYDTGSSDVLKVDSIIKDGSRIGLTDDFPTSWDSHCGVIPGCTNFVNNLSTAIYNYFEDFQGGNSNVSSVFVLNGVNISLPAPRLTLEPVVGFDSLWMYNNRTYTRNEIRATCLPGNQEFVLRYLAIMASAYILHRTDRTEEEYIMPKPSPDPEPNHPLGPLITIRILSDNSDPTSSMPFDTNWERMRIKARFGTIMAGGAGYWWEEGCDWLNPEDTPDKVALKHGHTIRIIYCEVPDGKADVLDVEFEKETDEL
ncbi:MFS general substrate transporter, partial [Aureobasidium melanogenum]